MRISATKHNLDIWTRTPEYMKKHSNSIQPIPSTHVWLNALLNLLPIFVQPFLHNHLESRPTVFTSLLITSNRISFSPLSSFHVAVYPFSCILFTIGNTPISPLHPCFSFCLFWSHPSIDIALHSINSAALILHCLTSTNTLQYRRSQGLT